MQTTSGRYLILRKIAVGGMAEIFLARRASLGQVSKFVVLKKISPEYKGKTTFEQLFIQEARITALLSHPNTVQLYELAEIDGSYCMSMEYIHGVSSAEMMSKAVQSKKPVPLEVTLGILVKTAYALEYCAQRLNHEGEELSILHNDVSPHNIQIRFDGEVKLLDFGVATQTHLSQSGGRRGKFAYMSPEAFQRQELDHRSDQFALGVVMFELLLGRRLFKGKTSEETKQKAQECEIPRPRSLAPKLPQEIEDILLKSLAKNRDERFESHLQFALAIEQTAKTLDLDISHRSVARYFEQIYGAEIAQRQQQLKALSEQCALIEAKLAKGESIEEIADIQVVELKDEIAKLNQSQKEAHSQLPSPPSIPQNLLNQAGIVKSNTPIAPTTTPTPPPLATEISVVAPDLMIKYVKEQEALPQITSPEVKAPEPMLQANQVQSEFLPAQPTMTKLFTAETDEAAENLENIAPQQIQTNLPTHLSPIPQIDQKPLAHDQDWDEVNKTQLNEASQIQGLKQEQRKSSVFLWLLMFLIAVVIGSAIGSFVNLRKYLQLNQKSFELNIESSPNGAIIEIGGIQKGQTPFRSVVDINGDYLDLKIKKKGFENFEKMIKVQHFQNQLNLDVSLQESKK
jgi:serine/threonine protein kinase